jgi:hypothetical protein
MRSCLLCLREGQAAIASFFSIWSLLGPGPERTVVLCTPAASAPPGASSPAAGSCARPGTTWCICHSPRWFRVAIGAQHADVRGCITLPDHRLEHPLRAPPILVSCPLLPNGREEPEPHRVSCAQGGGMGAGIT